MAKFIPNASRATVVPARSGGADCTAITMAWAKKVDVTSAVTTRAANSNGNPGARAETAFPTTETARSASISLFRSIPAVTAVSTGPPMIMPTAYAATSRPAVPTLTPRSAATSGRIPATTNSPVVMLKTQNMRMASRSMPGTLNSHVDVRVKPCNEWSGQVKIGELADRTGVSVRALRYYEERGVLRPDRTPSGYRIFADSDVHTVAHIQTL